MTTVAQNVLNNLKLVLKRIPFVLTTKRALYRQTYLISKFIFRLFRLLLIHPLMKFSVIRQLVFDTTLVPTVITANCETETFIVSSQDLGIGRMLACHGLLDYEALNTVIKLLGPEHSRDTIIDIGANIGSICIPAVSRGIFRNAIAIEPDPSNFAFLTSNIFLNRVSDKIIAHNLALGPVDEEQVIFELSESNFGDHRIRTKNDAGLYKEDKRKTLSVKSKTFDKVIGALLPTNSLIWMDTQGYEGHILAGAQGALAGRIPLVIEFWPYGMNRASSYTPLKDALLGFDYEWFYDLSDPSQKHSLTSEALDTIYSRLGQFGKFTDLLIL